MCGTMHPLASLDICEVEAASDLQFIFLRCGQPLTSALFPASENAYPGVLDER